MKHFSKAGIILLTAVFSFMVFGCKENEYYTTDEITTPKLPAPTNLVINSMTYDTYSCAVNFSFNYNGKTGLDGATYARLGYSTTNDSSRASNSSDTTAHLESGDNTRTVYIPSIDTPNFVPVEGKKYYFWLKVTSDAYNISDSAWSNVAEFTYSK